MPRAPRRCPRCETNLITAPAKYCRECLPSTQWKNSPNRARTSNAGWKRLKAAVHERDGHRCVDCGSTERLNCDHIVPHARGGSDAMSNLTTRCETCHRRKTSSEGGRAPRAPRSTEVDMGDSRRLRDLPGY